MQPTLLSLQENGLKNLEIERNSIVLQVYVLKNCKQHAMQEL